MIDATKLWKGAESARKLAELTQRKVKLYHDMADTLAIRAAYDLPVEGGVSFCIIDESDPWVSRVDNRGYGKGKYGSRGSRFPIRSIKGKVKIKHEGKLVVEDELLDFHRKTRGVFVRG